MSSLEQVNLEDLTELFQAIHRHAMSEGVRDRTHELHIDDALWGNISSTHRTISPESDEPILTVTTGADPIWGMQPRKHAYDILRFTPMYIPSGVTLPLIRRREYLPFNSAFQVPALGHTAYLGYGAIGETLENGGKLRVLPACEIPTLRATELLGAIRAEHSEPASAPPQ